MERSERTVNDREVIGGEN